ncbi:unnamed protein product [Ranitomeya imitator]|uniref:PH domain-containing protein n=1 Tax=Ranitomeya imitator TaxID=111125 RepID=A0ABN9LTT1_9NEOB|nr:unnamed protein product [Ranitomeya imitator]
MVVDDEEKANILNTFFSTVFTVENEMLGEIPRNNENPILRVTNLTQEEVRNRLNKIKIDKSPGPDGIHPRVLRELSNNQLSGYLLRKFKNSNGWQRLWVIFTNFCLYFYKTHQVDGSDQARSELSREDRTLN